MRVGEPLGRRRPAAEAARPGPEEEPPERPERDPANAVPGAEAAAEQEVQAQPSRNAGEQEAAGGESLAEWRDRALRLQAEIENFRKRQQRLAEERIREDRERLLRAFLAVSDDLERALGSDSNDAARLREGVELTHHGLMQLLDREGVETIKALGEAFDPELHEGIATVPHQQAGIEPNTVAQVVQTGYRYGDRLLRPARVVVAA
jgi:molecular chaperone GrpE